MSTEQMLDGVVSERDARLRERAAFQAGANWYVRAACVGEPQDEARLRYPIRKKVPRRVEIATGIFATTHRNGALAFLDRVGGAYRGDLSSFSEGQTDRIAELLANPFEEVEE